jgi:hypothetical protein
MTFGPIGATITPSIARPILEMEQLWSYVDSKGNEIWIWLALERQTRKVVGLAFGDRSADTCRDLWQSLPAEYRQRAMISAMSGVPSLVCLRVNAIALCQKSRAKRIISSA